MNAKADAEALLNVVMPFAEKMLAKHGEFYPYGAAMKPDGDIVSVAAYDGREQPPSADLIDLLRTELRRDAEKLLCKATAIVYDVRAVPPGGDSAGDAIAVALDHRDNYSVVVLFPYTIANNSVQIGEPFAERGEDAIFAR